MKRLLFVPLMLLLGACGFHLRGQADLPAVMDRTEIATGSPYSPLLRELRPLLESSGVELVTGEDATARLVISRDRLRKEVLSVGAEARVREYELIYEVAFSLQNAQGETIMEEQQLQLRRDYSFDESQLLGKAREEEFLREEMYTQMAGRIQRRLGSQTP